MQPVGYHMVFATIERYLDAPSGASVEVNLSEIVDWVLICGGLVE